MAWSLTADGSSAELSPWALPVFLLDIIILVPLLLLVEYTLMLIYPVFAIIEDEAPPVYNPVALSSQEDDDPDFKQPSSHGDDGDDDDGRSSHPITSSLRAINRLLTSHGGLRANLRGLSCSLAQNFLANLAVNLFRGFGAFVPLATLLASLALVQYAAAWVHIVVSHPSPKPFWRRLPPFKHTLAATWKPVVIHWAAVEVTNWLPPLLAALIGVNMPRAELRFVTSLNVGLASEALRSGDISSMLKCAVLTLLNLVLYIFAVIPAKVILIRVQASLLPVEQDTIIPFDRSFKGNVESAVVDGRGYASISDAWTTFSKAGWRRLVILYVKICSISFAFMLFCWAVLIPQAFLLIKPADKDPSL